MPGTTLGTAYVQIVPSAQGIKGSITNLMGGEAQEAGTAIGGTVGSFAKKALIAAGIGAATVKLIKGAIEEGGKLQQSYIGGVDTLYQDAADSVRKYAKEAAKAGISMNTYSEQAVSFGAALKSAYGGDVAKAAEAANTAILDMADNSAKMGTDIQSIQNAYQGFAKQNYTMLDNLKLGYGGTKTEMQRLLKDAEALTGIHYDIGNLGDVYEAIHAIQGELGLAGVAAAESEGTFTGSFASMKAAAQNFMGELALGMDVTKSLQMLSTSVSTFFFKNFLPMLGNIIRALPGAIATFVKTGIPLLIENFNATLTSLADWIQTKADGLTGEKVAAWIKTTLPKIIAAAGKLIVSFAGALIKNLPRIVLAIGKIGLAIISGLGSALFGKVAAAARGIVSRFMAPINTIKGKFKSIIDTIKSWFPIRLGNLFKGIKLPHFYLEWSSFTAFGRTIDFPVGFDIEWYKQGGIFNQATVAGIGEAGPEAVVPLDKFWDKLDNMQSGGDISINVYATPSMDVNQLALKIEQRLVQVQKQRTTAYGGI